MVFQPAARSCQHSQLIYNLLWSKSIWDGYQRNEVDGGRSFCRGQAQRGTQRRRGHVVGDIGANMASLAEHMNAQMHMALSGIDYFGSDVGGFHRQASDPDLSMDEVYTPVVRQFRAARCAAAPACEQPD